MKRVLLPLLAVAVCAALAVPALAGTRAIKIGDNYFVTRGKPQTVHIHRGSSLRFEWQGHTSHNVVVAHGPQTFRSPVKTSGTYTRRFAKRGKYLLLCTIHPATMRLNVVVQ
jgi:plastocyanin